MKNTVKFLGIIVLAAIIGFAVTSCGGGKSSALIEMVRVEGGAFTMGSPTNEPGRFDNETQRQVTLTNGFWIGKYPVTQKQYQAVMGYNPSWFCAHGGGAEEVTGLDTSNFPVEVVSWYEALVFCNMLSILEGLSPAYSINGSTNPDDWETVGNWDRVIIVEGSNGYRLPTEAQWEYACRAGTTTAFNWGTNTINSTQANYHAEWVDANNTMEGTFFDRTSEVGSYAPNAWGLYDMHGNVWEWCWDWYGDYVNRSQIDPQGAPSGSRRVLRGGSWWSSGQYVRSAYRDWHGPSVQVARYGFRVLRP